MHTTHGFTLLELIIVLIISVLLITIGIPGFQTLVQNNRLTAASSSIHSSLLFARNQSISYLNYVTICPLENDVCGNDWASGLDIFIDSDNRGVYDNDEVLLKLGEAFNASDTLVFPTTRVTFTPDGQITGNSALFRYCSGDSRVGISLSYGGRAKIISDDEFEDCD